MANKNNLYLILAIFLLILSVIGGYFLFENFQKSNQSSYKSDIIPKIETIPTDIPIAEEPIVTPEIIVPIATDSTNKVTPTKVVTKTPTLIPTQKPVISIKPTTSTSNSSNLKNYSNSVDGFSVSYSSSRQFIQDTEDSGNRYNFTSSLGNFAIHVSPSGTWSWTHPNRQFSQTFVVSNQPTFRYDINSQTIVDLQSSTKNYTLQCIHNGKESLKTECEVFIQSFKLL